MFHADRDALEATLTRARDHAARFARWLEHLRAADPEFAEASALHPNDEGEWQAAVYLLIGCNEVWNLLARDVLAHASIAPVIEELAKPRRAWCSSEYAVMEWSVHFWNLDRWPAKFPYVFEHHDFERWITACHLYMRITPAHTSSQEGTPCR